MKKKPYSILLPPDKILKISIFFIGIILLLVYYLCTIQYQFFVRTDWVYASRFPEPEVIGMLYKILMLLPAAFCFAFSSIDGADFFTPLYNNQRITIQIITASVFIILIIFSHMILDSTPVTVDEYTYRFQAEILKNHRLFAPPPPVQSSFTTKFLIVEPDCMTGFYPLGFPLILLAGLYLGSPYIFTILMSVGQTFLVYKISLEWLKQKKTAIITTLLFSISPLFLFTSSTLLTHSASGFFLLSFIWFFLRSVEKGKFDKKTSWAAFVAGLCAGYAFNIRPLSTVALCFPMVLRLVYRTIRTKRYSILIFMLFGFTILLIPTLWYNHIITGSWHKLTVEYFTDSVNAGHPEHTVSSGLVNFLSISYIRLNSFLYGFPISFIVYLPIFFFKRLDRRILVCIATVLFFIFAFFFWWYPGVSDTGPVYYYELLFPLSLIAAWGIRNWSIWHNRHFPFLRGFVSRFLIISLCIGIFSFHIEKAFFLKTLTRHLSAPYRFCENRLQKALVLVDKQAHVGCVDSIPPNSPSMREDEILYCLYLDDDSNERVIQAFPERTAYILTINGTEYWVKPYRKREN